MDERPATHWIRAALAFVVWAAVVAGVWLRAAPLSGAFLYGDELHTLPALGAPTSVLARHYDAVGSGLALPLLQKATVAVLGVTLPALRAVAFVPSLLLVAAVALLARREADGTRVRAGVAGSVCLVATGSLFVFYGHFARSYSLAALACIATLLLVLRALDLQGGETGSPARAPGWRAALAIALCGGLACWAHLTSAFFLVGMGVGALAYSLRVLGVAGTLRSPALHGLAGGAALALLLHLPALDSLLAFVGHKGEQVYYGGFDALDVLRVLAGSNAGAWLVLGALVLASPLELRARGARALPLVCATWLPPLVLALASPFGDAYAYARYLLPSAATGAVLIAAGAARAGARVRRAGVPASLPAVALAALLLACGPLGIGAPRLGRFENTYLALHRLPAFTAKPPPAPAPYAAFARAPAGLRIVEAPPMPNRSMHYLLALAAWHGQDVRIGTFGPLVPGAPRIDSPLYVDLSDTDALEGRFDRLVVHRRLLGEIRRYWTEVYADDRFGPDAAFMERHRIYGRNVPGVGDRVIEQLGEVLGPPEHVDDEVVVWSGDALDAAARGVPDPGT